jgi:hypothetical protein
MLNNFSTWPTELWSVLVQLHDQSQQENRSLQPQVTIYAKGCPEYLSSRSQTRDAFNAAVIELERDGMITIEWLPNAGHVITKLRLNIDRADNLKAFLEQAGKLRVPKKRSPRQIEQWRAQAAVAVSRFGSLGLKTLSQIITGNTKTLLPSDLELLGLTPAQCWVQPDITVHGANLVRVAGDIELESATQTCRPRWDVPGHFIWDWNIDALRVECIGTRLILVENPYAMWELMRRFPNGSTAYLCLHGETHFESSLDSTLGRLLAKVYTHTPRLETWIWCDPDPAGLRIANHAHDLVQKLGGQSRFWQMDAGALDRLTRLILVSEHLRSVDEKPLRTFAELNLHPDLEPLRQAILQRRAGGEQEALVVDLETDWR